MLNPYTGTVETWESLGVCVWGGGGGGRFFQWIRGHACPENVKTKFSSLLIRFIMAIGGKYKTS